MVRFFVFTLLAYCACVTADAASNTASAARPWRQTVQKFALEHFKNPAWGYSHCVRDYALARDLAATDHVTLDDDVLFAASYLHDMAAFKPWEEAKLDHSDVGAKTIDIVLNGTDFPKAKLDAVRAAIRTHMYYRVPVAPEAIYLHDADALDWLGAIGIARVIALTGSDDMATTGDSIKSIEDTLAKVPSKVVSPAGRAQIAPRVAEVQQFLENLRRETDNLKTL